jgi:hypothetical protein
MEQRLLKEAFKIIHLTQEAALKRYGGSILL